MTDEKRKELLITMQNARKGWTRHDDRRLRKCFEQKYTGVDIEMENSE